MNRIMVVALLVIAAPQIALSQTKHTKPNRNIRAALGSIPKVSFLYPAPYGTVFDRNCPQLLKTQVDAEWVRETVRRLPEFQERWDREGPAYLSATFAEIGLKFPYRPG
jgi:hypothetical protein